MPQRDALNIVVYDATERRLPLALTCCWRAAGALARVTGRADVVIGADTWPSALAQVRDVVRRRSTAAREARIGLLQFWGHGSDGAMLIAGERLETASLAPGSRLLALLEDVRLAMDPVRGRVWFRGCNTFRGEEGLRFAQSAAAFFGVPVVGHTFIIWAFHSGTHVLAPDASPCWPADEGVAPARRSRSRWSGPFRPRTIAALQFYPPAR